VRKWPFMARRYGRCCMYGPDYVKLSRFFAVQLFSMSIGHYAALCHTPGPIRPPLAPQPCNHRLHLPRASPSPIYTATPAARRDPNPNGATQTPISLYACSQRVLGVARPSPLALGPRSLCLDKTRQPTHTARDSNLGSGNQDTSRLSEFACPSGAPIHIHGLADTRHTSTPAPNGYWVWHPRPSPSPRHCNAHYSRPKPQQWQPRHAQAI
jgi:hypothetical protein